MKRRILKNSTLWGSFCGALFVSALCFATEPLPVPPQTGLTPAEQRAITPPANSALSKGPQIHSDGVFDDSYFRQMQRPMTSYIERGGMPQANGWTSYGFPARQFHWGYFGAERHDPSVMWHQGYYGDKVRVANRYWY